MATPTQLAIVRQPTNAILGENIPPIIINVEDVNGNIVTNSAASVTATLTTGNGALAGSTTVSATNGVASFYLLTVTAVGTGCTLTFTSPGLPSVTSAAFSVLPIVPSIIYTTVSSGNWSNRSIWNPDPGAGNYPGLVPSNGDYAIIQNNVNIDVPVTLGNGSVGISTSPLYCLTFLGGNLAFINPVKLTLFGSARVPLGYNPVISGCGTIAFDGSTIVHNPTDGNNLTQGGGGYYWTILDVYTSNSSLYPVLTFRGTSATQPLIVETINGSNNAYFWADYSYGGGYLHAQYVQFKNIGDSLRAAEYIREDPCLITVGLDHCVSYSCGLWGGWAGDENIIFNNSVFTKSQQSPFTLSFPSLVAEVTVSVTNCDFDRSINVTNSVAGLLTSHTGNTFRAATNNTWQVQSPAPYPPVYYTVNASSTQGNVNTPSANFTVAFQPTTETGGSYPTGTSVPIVLSDNGAGGTFTPSSLTLTNTSPSQTFTYTPVTIGPVTLSFSNTGVLATTGGHLVDPPPIVYISTAIATSYTLSAPVVDQGMVGVASGNFVVALPSYAQISVATTIIPSDNAGGSFSPSVTVLNPNTVGAYAVFTYTPVPGTTVKTISTMNNGGLIDPPSVEYTVVPQATSCSIAGPSVLDCSTTGTYTLSLVGGALPSNVTITLVEDLQNCRDNQISNGVFSPSTITLGPGVSSGVFNYTPHTWGPVILTGTGLTCETLGITARVQLGSSGSSSALGAVEQTPDLGCFDPFHGGSAWWAEIARPIVNDATHPNNAYLALQLTENGAANNITFSCSTSGVSTPINVIPSTQQLYPLTIVNYPSPNCPVNSSMPLTPYLDIEAFDTSQPPYIMPTSLAAYPDQTDHHCLMFLVDEVGGGITGYNEVYDVTWNGVSGSGAAFEGASGVILNYNETIQEGCGDTAGGLPMAPLMIRYDEAAFNPKGIAHATRCELINGIMMFRYVWPGRNTSYWDNIDQGFIVLTEAANIGDTIINCMALSSSAAAFTTGSNLIFQGSGVIAVATAAGVTGGTTISVQPLSGAISVGDCCTVDPAIPYGSRLRISESWYNSNQNSWAGNNYPVAQTILEHLRNYGLIVDDGTVAGIFSFDGVNDWRWTNAVLSAVGKIPRSAFEIVECNKWTSLAVPGSTIIAGQSSAFTITVLITGNTASSGTLYLYYSMNGGVSWAVAGYVAYNADTSPGPFVIHWTPAVIGPAILRVKNATNNWYPSPAVPITILPAVATTYTVASPAPTHSSPGVTSGNYTISLSLTAQANSPVTITPSDNGAGGTFSPSTVVLAAGTPGVSGVFTYTPASYGVKTISFTNNGGLTNPSSVSYTCADLATTYNISCLPGGIIVVSLPANTVIGSAVTISMYDGGAGGSFTAMTPLAVGSFQATTLVGYEAKNPLSTSINISASCSTLTNPASIPYVPGPAANPTNKSIATDNTVLSGVSSLLNGGVVNVYSGTQPAACGAVTSQILLCSIPLGNPAFSASVNNLATLVGTPSGNPVSSGTATWARWMQPNGTVVMDTAVGTAVGQLQLSTTSIVMGVPVLLSGVSLVML